MNIRQLINAVRRPPLYTPGTASMWEDEYISGRLLEVHLSQETDLASRKKSTILSTIDWLCSRLPQKPLRILDLGCGPGLYAEELARRGHLVTGMDISAGSLSYAGQSAQKNNLEISYIHRSYLELDAKEQYDLILLIFTDFGVLPPPERADLLSRVHRALKPGGKFIFDVLNDGYSQSDPPAGGWEVCAGGFWRKEPYLTLSQSYRYKEKKVSLDQHVVLGESGKLEIYRFWVHTFNRHDLNRMLSQQGFTSVACFDGILPDSELYDADWVTFCIADK